MATADATFEALIEQAQQGDQSALDGVVRAVQDRIYGLAVRMLGDPAEAEDATQEILIRIVGNLGSFRGESAFTTWVFRVASNYLLTARKRRAGQMRFTFTGLEGLLDQGLQFTAEAAEQPEVESGLLEEEVKISCTQSMLLCLDRSHRLAFILSEILEVTGAEGAAILEISPEAFRKRVSRARERLRAFMERRCGLVNPESPCRCSRQVPFALQIGLVQPEHLRFAGHPVRAAASATLVERVRELETLERMVGVFRSHPDYAARPVFAERLKAMVASGHFRVLADETGTPRAK